MTNLKSFFKAICLKFMTPSQMSICYANMKFFYYCSKDLLKATLGRIRIMKQKGKPRVLQFPITNLCNLRCKTCNVYEVNCKGITSEQVHKMVTDDLFSNITSVGVNGGEPFLLSNINEYIIALLQLPKLKNINIISNGVLTGRILDKLELIHKTCKERGVQVGFTTSLDGNRDINDKIRGVKGVFDKTIQTYNEIKNNKNKYCDKLGIICTISQYNIYHINDFIAYLKINNIENVSFQLAVVHQRLYNDDIPSFSVLDDQHAKMLAQEFFYSKFLETKKKKYYFIFKYLRNNGSGDRMSVCHYADRDVTVDACGNLLYCATHSKKIGHVDDDNLSNIFYSKQNIDYRKKLVKEKCNSCIHYTSNNGFLKANIEVYKALRNISTWTHEYAKSGRK